MDLDAWGRKILTFGKHAGKTYDTVAERETTYCLWARNQTNPSGGLADFVSYLEKVQSLQPPQKRLRYSEPAGFVPFTQQCIPTVPLSLSYKDQKLNASHSLSQDARKPPSRKDMSFFSTPSPSNMESETLLPPSHVPPTRVASWPATPYGDSKRQSLPNPNTSVVSASLNIGPEGEHQRFGFAGSQSLSQSFSQSLVQSASQPPYTFDPTEYSLSPIEKDKPDSSQCHLGHVVLRLCSPEHYTVLVKSTTDARFTTFVPSELFQALLPFRSRTAEDRKPEKGRWSHPGFGKTTALMLPAETYGQVYHLLQKHFKFDSLEGLPNFVLLAFERFRPFLKKAYTVDRKSANILAGICSPRTKEKAGVLEQCLGPKLSIALKPFQITGIRYGLSKNGRCLIADEMGLGKTLQALGIASVYHDEWPCLIIAPSSIRFQWRDQIARWLPHLVTPQQIAVIRSGKQVVDLSQIRVVIVSYDLAKSTRFHKAAYQVIICDESHYLKNPSSQRATTIVPKLQQARRAILLSGTPALNRPTELFSQLSALIPKFAAPKDFASRYAEMRVNPWTQRPEFTGYRLPEELHTFLTQTVMIRRLKADVGSQLPPKLRSKVPVECSLKELKEIRQLMTSYALDLDSISERSASCTSLTEYFSGQGITQPRGAAALSETSNATSSGWENGNDQTPQNSNQTHGAISQLFLLSGKGKVAAVCDYISYLLASAGCKMVIFAHHKAVLGRLEEHLNHEKVPHIRVDGAVSEAQRETRIKRFQTDQQCKVALLSITACSHGLNLTAAGTVVFAELYWVPGVVVQAEDRCHRIGTTFSAINVHYLIAEGTVDELMWRILMKKWSLVKNTLDGVSEMLYNPQAPPPAPLVDHHSTYISSSSNLSESEGLFSSLFEDKNLLEEIETPPRQAFIPPRFASRPSLLLSSSQKTNTPLKQTSLRQHLVCHGFVLFTQSFLASQQARDSSTGSQP